MLSPETFEVMKQGGAYLLLLMAVGWLIKDRTRLLESLADKDKIIAAKDDLIHQKDEKLGALAERTLTAIIESRELLKTVVDMFKGRMR